MYSVVETLHQDSSLLPLCSVYTPMVITPQRFDLRQGFVSIAIAAHFQTNDYLG